VQRLHDWPVRHLAERRSDLLHGVDVDTLYAAWA